MIKTNPYPNSYKVYYRRSNTAIFIMAAKFNLCIVFLVLGSAFAFFSTFMAVLFTALCVVSLGYGEYLERLYVRSIKQRTIHQISKLSEKEFDTGLKEFMENMVDEKHRKRVKIDFYELFLDSRMTVNI